MIEYIFKYLAIKAYSISLVNRMKSLNGKLNIKRIATIAAGAALLGMGIAFAAPVTFQNVPVISNSGQPVVQIVVGSNARPADGVTAANLAAAIGNLAYTSVPVTASVNPSSTNALKAAVSSSNYTLSNAQVWLNESGVSSASGSYSFTTLIGSVLNAGIQLGVQNTKSLDNTGTYSFNETNSISVSPVASPYSSAGFVPLSSSVSSSSNGGGVSFASFTKTSGSKSLDNIVQVGGAQLPGLMSNVGAYHETENLWLTGFPVYDQATGVSNFALLDADGAYQATFGSPIPIAGQGATIPKTATGGYTYNIIRNVQFGLLGQNWTIINATFPTANTVSTVRKNGGKLQLAQSLSPLETVYVGHNITSGPWTVVVPDLGQPTSQGISPAGLDVYYNGQLTNVTSVTPGTGLTHFNVSNNNLYVLVNQTFAGLYAYQKYAKVQVYANTYNLTDGHVYNQTTNPNWYVNIFWTNGTASPGWSNELQSIVIYGTSSAAQTLTPGQSISFITSPATWKLEFVGDTLGSASGFDAVTATSTQQSTINYQNIGANTPATAVSGLKITNITEAGDEMTVTSQISGAFSYGGQSSSSILYDLTPYKLVESANQLAMPESTVATTGPDGNWINGNTANRNTIVTINYIGLAGYPSTANPVTVLVSGYVSNTATSPTSTSIIFSTNGPATSGNQVISSVNFFNITNIQLQTPLPGTLTVNVIASNGLGGDGYMDGLGGAGNAILLASLVNTAQPEILYGPTSGHVYDSVYPTVDTTAANVIYNQQNGQPTSVFQIASNTAGEGLVKTQQYFTYQFGEVAVPTNTAAVDQLGFGIQNNTGGVTATPQMQLNYSLIGQHNNMSYTSTQNNQVFAQQGFRTERGSKVASISPSSVTVDLAKSVDTLQFITGASTSAVTHGYTIYPTTGPGYGIGQATNIPNVSIYKVTGTPVLSGATYTVTGINSLTATPSVTSATQPVLLTSLTTTPLAVLDNGTNSASNLILIGSGYVNSLSGQLEKEYNITVSPSMGGSGAGYIVQAYGANRIYVAGYSAAGTTAAGNKLIQCLYQAAAGSSSC